MFTRNTSLGYMVIVLLSGMSLLFLMGQDCSAQGGICDPDPCQSIPNAETGTCVPVGGCCTDACDYFCSCKPGYTWVDASHSCEWGPNECQSALDQWNSQTCQDELNAALCPHYQDCVQTCMAGCSGPHEECWESCTAEPGSCDDQFRAAVPLCIPAIDYLFDSDGHICGECLNSCTGPIDEHLLDWPCLDVLNAIIACVDACPPP